MGQCQVDASVQRLLVFCWGTLQLSGVRKGDSDVRPLAAPETLRRLLGKALCVQYKERFSGRLFPEQCAVGLAGGTEVAQKTLSVFADCHP